MADFEGWRTPTDDSLCIRQGHCASQAPVHRRLLCIPHTLLLFPRVLFPPLPIPLLSLNMFECACLTMCKQRQMKGVMTCSQHVLMKHGHQHGASTRSRVTRSIKRLDIKRLDIRSNPFSPILFFLSWVANTQLDHWTKWVVCTQLTPHCCTQTVAECDSLPSPQPRHPP